MALYTCEFYRRLPACAAARWVLSLRAVADHGPATMARLLASLQRVPGGATVTCSTMPLYGTLWAMAMASDRVDPLT